MSSFVYLIRNGDLYKIGTTNNLQSQITLLKPDEIIKTLEVKDPNSLEARLFRRYKSTRVPDSNYFRLSAKQLSDCKKQLGQKGRLPVTISDEFSIGVTGSVLLITLSAFVFIYLGQGFLKSFVFSFALGSIPMWTLFVFGDFGGYDVKDLPLFSSWFNRLKAFLMAAFITSLAYALYFLIN